MIQKCKIFISLLFTFNFFLLNQFVYAHKINIFAYVENGMVILQSYFSDGKKCKNSAIEVYDEKEGIKLLEGKTDEEGKFSFKIPKFADLKLILKASMGHQVEYIISKEELVDNSLENNEFRDIEEKDSQGSKYETSENEFFSQTVEIEKIVGKVVERKLKPIKSILVKMNEENEKRKIHEIIGGVGYIVGIFGIILFLRKNYKKG